MTANPTLLSMPLAQNGQKNVLPTTQATAGDGLFSQSTGFPAETSLPLGAGGVAPSREDFNGLANLLGGVAFMAQKGFTFNYDATQDYYVGCVVMDGGIRYLCIADMAAGTVAPSADTTHTYWTFYPIGVINKRDVVTTSGTYTAPFNGWYKITVKGGGGGGSAGNYFSGAGMGGRGGGEGGTTIAYEHMNAGDTATVVIGGGGNGGTTNGADGANGGDSSVTVGANTYTGEGGTGGKTTGGYYGGVGGTGTINGCAGGSGDQVSDAGSASSFGGEGGGNGGGVGGYNKKGTNGTQGGGGAGGSGNTSGGEFYAGGNGGAGFVWFEYFAEV